MTITTIDPGFFCDETAAGWFEEHFAGRVPLDLRSEAAALSWSDFSASYGPCGGPLRLGQWAGDDDERLVAARGPQLRIFRGVLAFGDRIGTATATASGPVAALTAMLYERGMPVEVLKFHQLSSGAQTATFILAGDGTRIQWSMCVAEDSTLSALRALITCANRLLAARDPA